MKMFNNSNKTIGSILLYTGTAIGGGMLALPIATYSVGYGVTAMIFLLCWFILTYTALLLLEVNLACKLDSNFSSMAQQTLGSVGKVITWLSYLFLLYALTAAYMTGGNSLIEAGLKSLNLPTFDNFSRTLFFTLLLGGFVFIGAKLVDYFNRGLMFLKLIAFLFILFFFTPYIKTSLLETHPESFKSFLFAIPIIVVSFGSHVIVPSLRSYVGDNVKQLRNIVIIGGTIPLIIYLIWEVGTLGVLPVTGIDSFSNIIASGGSVGDMVIAFQNHTQSKIISAGFNLFTNIAITTSFFGVTLSLFDFIRDGFKLNNNYSSGRLVAYVLSYGPPFFFAVCYPKGFITALGYAGIAASLLIMILPALMAYKLRKSKELKSPYQVMFGNFGLFIAALFGIFVICVEVFHKLS
ncbi:tyrosine-specific transport protein [Paraphotobacterium marinum]|uniref:Tyrosine-specific transport protein n=2 Tax=Paraphotobacterium marinum TaxID=1755811 RepID=A0A220VFZ5_9GAMM|nr:tyrosine-specific transport protein [Paraphotobacterium marinum]